LALEPKTSLPALSQVPAAAEQVTEARVKAKLPEDRRSAMLATGRKIARATIRDAFSRLSAAIELRFNFRAARECERGAPLLALVITYTFWSGMRVGIFHVIFALVSEDG
jgi:hypothetical protein